jgi:hypothetical protein
VVQIGSPINCTAVVTDVAGSGATAPLGTVNFTKDGAAGGSCQLLATNSTTSQCSVTFTSPSAAQVWVIVATYAGDDDVHAGSSSDRVPIVFYDASGGFVTGGGWIISPAGSAPGSPTATGKTNFGFNAKYTKGVAGGETEFQFKEANINFHSTSYDYLVITAVACGYKGQYTGSGTINGVAGYGFNVTVIDCGSTDKFRIRIWNKTTGLTVYDSELPPGTLPDNADPTTTSLGGNIVIHNK